jgi:hypothetical protein
MKHVTIENHLLTKKNTGIKDQQSKQKNEYNNSS